MSKKRKKQPVSHAIPRAPAPGASGAASLTAALNPLRRQSRGKRRDASLYWIIGFVVVAIVAIIWAARPKPPPAIAEPITSQEALLPLATPVRPLTGIHDMKNQPPPPAPREVPADQPQADVDVPVLAYDFGSIPRHPKVQQTFPIQNKGDEALLVSWVGTSCGCTVGQLSSSVIPPGQRADLTVTFDPAFHAEAVGPVTRVVWVDSNDPDQPRLEFRVEADVLTR